MSPRGRPGPAGPRRRQARLARAARAAGRGPPRLRRGARAARFAPRAGRRAARARRRARRAAPLRGGRRARGAPPRAPRGAGGARAAVRAAPAPRPPIPRTCAVYKQRDPYAALGRGPPGGAGLGRAARRRLTAAAAVCTSGPECARGRTNRGRAAPRRDPALVALGRAMHARLSPCGRRPGRAPAPRALPRARRAAPGRRPGAPGFRRAGPAPESRASAPHNSTAHQKKTQPARAPPERILANHYPQAAAAGPPSRARAARARPGARMPAPPLARGGPAARGAPQARRAEFWAAAAAARRGGGPTARQNNGPERARGPYEGSALLAGRAAPRRAPRCASARRAFLRAGRVARSPCLIPPWPRPLLGLSSQAFSQCPGFDRNSTSTLLSTCLCPRNTPVPSHAAAATPMRAAARPPEGRCKAAPAAAAPSAGARAEPPAPPPRPTPRGPFRRLQGPRRRRARAAARQGAAAAGAARPAPAPLEFLPHAAPQRVGHGAAPTGAGAMQGPCRPFCTRRRRIA